MPPSPGKIQSLPIKVLYTIDTSPQSYLTVLPDKQDVYVHPSAPNSTDLLGSVALKSIAKGICYASPECVPNRTSLDFTVYNLEPAIRPPASSRAFPSPTQHPPPAASWTGRGFLSWALAEQGAGSTLAKGRLVREYEFSPACFAEGGGLEGLMAAAATGGAEDVDGKGWGVEVTLTLRQLNPEGKAEFSGRREFENMLAGGKSSASAPLAVTSSPVREKGGVFVRPAVPAPKPPSPLRRAVPNGNANGNAVAGPSRLPAPAGPSRLPPPSPAKHVKTERPTPRPRETTPPPKPAVIPQTPPTPSPSRARIMDLLKSEAQMSPNLAKRLVGNPFLVKLMQTLPESSEPSSSAPPVAASSPFRVRNDKAPPPASDPGEIERCGNCGTTESEQWFTKKMRGDRIARVCHPCGIHYNQHKNMRPRELWASGSGTGAGAPRSDPPPSTSAPPPPAGVRSSPRLNRTRQDPPTPVESPRKRARKAPTPSPRRTTRASARKADAGERDEATTPTPGGIGVGSLDFSSHFPFGGAGVSGGTNGHAPEMSAGAGAGPGDRLGHTRPGEAHADGTDSQDLTALFLDFRDEVPSAGVDGMTLESMFGTDDTNDILAMLHSLESEGEVHVSQSEP